MVNCAGCEVSEGRVAAHWTLAHGGAGAALRPRTEAMHPDASGSGHRFIAIRRVGSEQAAGLGGSIHEKGHFEALQPAGEYFVRRAGLDPATHVDEREGVPP